MCPLSLVGNYMDLIGDQSAEVAAEFLLSTDAKRRQKMPKTKDFSLFTKTLHVEQLDDRHLATLRSSPLSTISWVPFLSGPRAL